MAFTNGTSTKKIPSPSKLAHVVLRTNNLDNMVEFYLNFLGARVVHRNPTMCFITYDNEHHRMAFLQMPGLEDKVKKSCGLEHIAFSYDSFDDLLTAYHCRATQAKPVKPIWCVNHGPTTSIYYKDPDGNTLETQVDQMSDQEATTYMENVSTNPFGLDFDPEELLKLLRTEGEEAVHSKQLNMGDTGTRTFESLPAAFTA